MVELAVLNKRYARKGAVFIILYGRRRVGKSELIEHFLKTTRGIRFLAREESKYLQLKKISRNCVEFFMIHFYNRVLLAIGTVSFPTLPAKQRNA
ncbi:MAG: hypothetical protein NTV68_09920 [Methanomicrobiales archaeon]|nr:hypothetical protein [Methanomicrobiales archaeon]